MNNSQECLPESYTELNLVTTYSLTSDNRYVQDTIEPVSVNTESELKNNEAYKNQERVSEFKENIEGLHNSNISSNFQDPELNNFSATEEFGWNDASRQQHLDYVLSTMTKLDSELNSENH